MRKDLRLNLNIDTGEGRSVKVRQDLATFPRDLAMIVATRETTTDASLFSFIFCTAEAIICLYTHLQVHGQPQI